MNYCFAIPTNISKKDGYPEMMKSLKKPYLFRSQYLWISYIFKENMQKLFSATCHLLWLIYILLLESMLRIEKYKHDFTTFWRDPAGVDVDKTIRLK